MINNKTGLVSISFRQLSVEDIIKHVKMAGLDGIEWGGDVHAPHGDVAACKKVGDLTREAGLDVLCYGSYYRIAQGGDDALEFKDVLDSAVALGAPMIRVWAGMASADATESDWQAAVDDSIRIASMSHEKGIRVVYEFHCGTLTDSVESAKKLYERVDHENVGTLWQPINHEGVEVNLQAIGVALPRMENVHTFHWKYNDGQCERRPLSEGIDIWSRYVDRINSAGKSRAFLLEFVRGDAIEQFYEDANTLKELLGNL